MKRRGVCVSLMSQEPHAEEMSRDVNNAVPRMVAHARCGQRVEKAKGKSRIQLNLHACIPGQPPRPPNRYITAGAFPVSLMLLLLAARPLRIPRLL